MIDINKKYTFNGCNGVLVTTTRNRKNFPVVWIGEDDGDINTFTSDGCYSPSGVVALIEVKPTRWVNLYPDNPGNHYHATKAIADEAACNTRIACIEVKDGDGI